MKHHLELSDLEFEKQFENCTLNPELFNHEAHLRLAWLHISKYGIDKAIENLRNQIKQYAASLGASEKYNETVTVASVRAVYHFMLQSKTNNFSEFIKENPRLKNNLKELLGLHYDIDVFTSAEAKKEYQAPKHIPFD